MEDVTIETITKHFPALDFTVVAEVHDYRVEFKIYEISGFEEGETKGVYDSPVWRKASATSSGLVVDALEESEVYLHGHVKWDGCSNWHFDEQDRCMLHGCSKANVQRFGDIMAACWDWASELCPNWMDLCAARWQAGGRMECTEEMLTAAVKKAVEVGLLPKIGFGDQVAENWGRVRAMIEAALAVAPQNAGD